MPAKQKKPALIDKEHQLIAASEGVQKKGEEMALGLFQAVTASNALYKRYLAEHNVNVSAVKTIKDFTTKVPTIDKHFLHGKGIPELCPDYLTNVYAYSESSGMTGQPLQIPRLKDTDLGIKPAVDSLFCDLWDIDKKPTLSITGWAMGTWVAGTLMDKIMKEISMEKGYQLSTVSPGAIVDKTADLIQIHAENYSSYGGQTIIQGYPPYVAEVIYTLERRGVDIQSLNIRLFIAGEPISEDWRMVMQRKLSLLGEKDLQTVISLLGTAEGGVMAFETRLSVLVRKLAQQNPELALKLFGSNKGIPMVFQYVPTSKYLEEENGEIVFTGKSGIPSVRYNMHDDGGVRTFKDVLMTSKQFGINLLDELDALGYGHKPVAPLPFVFVYGRSDGGISIDGGNIYPLNVEPILGHERIRTHKVNDYMLDVYEEKETGRMRLMVHLEMEEGIDPLSYEQEIITEIEQIILESIMVTNGDFAKSYYDNPVSATPIVKLHPKGQGVFEVNGKKLKRTRIKQLSS